MKVVISGLTDNYIDKFTLSKSIDNTFVKTEINSEVIYSKDDFQTLIEKAATAQGNDTGTLEYFCEDVEIIKDIEIKHNEGTYDLGKCEAKKKIVIANPLDCIALSEVNIFDYPSGVTGTIQGTLNRIYHEAQEVLQLGTSENEYTLDQILSTLGGIPNYENIGYYPEYIWLQCKPVFEISDENTGYYNGYLGHRCTLRVYYVQFYNATQFNSDWLPYPIFGGFFYNPDLFPRYQWGSPIYETLAEFQPLQGILYYRQTDWYAGKINQYKQANISNTISLNDVLQGVFQCTGLELVSNFLGINEDATNPNNKYYDYATKYCKEIKICQSFDIIRESAIQDSFGLSGKIKGKDLLADISQKFNMVIIPDIDNNLIRWEHVSYFQTKGFDFSSRNEIEIKPLELSREPLDREVFTMANNTPTSGFYSISIDYQTTDLYRETAERQYQIKNILTDVFGTINNEDYNKPEYEKLFYLLSTSNGKIIGLNNQFSMNRIFRELHDINRPYKRGTSGTESFEFAGFSIGFETEIKTQTGITNFDTLFPTMAIKTKFGSFLITELNYDENKILTLKVRK